MITIVVCLFSGIAVGPLGMFAILYWSVGR